MEFKDVYYTVMIALRRQGLNDTPIEETLAAG